MLGAVPIWHSRRPITFGPAASPPPGLASTDFGESRMSDYDDQDDFDQNDDQQDEPQPDRNPLRAELRKAQKEAKAFKAEAEAGKTAVRELAFLRAGIDLKAPGAKSFVKAYDGELTAEAITAAAVEDGIVAPVQDEVPADERAAFKRIADTGSGAKPPGSHDYAAQIAEARANKQFQRVIELTQMQAQSAR